MKRPCNPSRRQMEPRWGVFCLDHSYILAHFIALQDEQPVHSFTDSIRHNKNSNQFAELKERIGQTGKRQGASLEEDLEEAKRRRQAGSEVLARQQEKHKKEATSFVGSLFGGKTVTPTSNKGSKMTSTPKEWPKDAEELTRLVEAQNTRLLEANEVRAPFFWLNASSFWA